jgi:glycosyltransferase involved in cell wall biosynthesis
MKRMLGPTINRGDNTQNLPKISIVTPTYNQVDFLEETIISVLSQGYPSLEYIIIDGGSDDGSVDVIKKYEKYLHYWVTEPDLGQYDAINKGFSHSTGEIMAWINSDDVFGNWAFRAIGQIFSMNPKVEWVTTLFPLILDADGVLSSCFESQGYSKNSFYEGRHCGLYPHKKLRYIQQESTFWRRSLWEKSGACLTDRFPLAGDFELWARFFQYAKLFCAPIPLSGFRVHEGQKSQRIELYLKECANVLELYGHSSAKAALRSILGRSCLPRIPLLRFLFNKLFGYEIFTFKTLEEGNSSSVWHPVETRKLM